MAVVDTVNRLITDVYAGKLHPRIARGLAPLMHLQLRGPSLHDGILVNAMNDERRAVIKFFPVLRYVHVVVRPMGCCAVVNATSNLSAAPVV
jgi:hypothetical protein